MAMITLSGKSVFGGIAIGKILFYKRNEITIKRSHVEDTEAEIKRFEKRKNRRQQSFSNYMTRQWMMWVRQMP